MKRLIYVLTVIALITVFSGCVSTGYNAVKTGVTDTYGGGKTILTDLFTGAGNLIGGEKSVKVSIEFGSDDAEE